jgi:ABC-type uncharacterized transport system ATPase subunit
MIQFKGVAKSFKDVYAVRDITCEMYDKEIFGLLGPNGALGTGSIDFARLVYLGALSAALMFVGFLLY